MKRALILCGGGSRGAFQAGVLKYLDEKGWRPDLICGASAGAINAVAIGSGMTPDKIITLWKRFDRRKIYRISLARHLRSFFNNGESQSLTDTSPLKKLLVKYIDINKLRQSNIEILINAVHLPTSRLKYFTQHQIDISHIMASSAIPVLFPWQFIDGEPYWDGGMIENTPLAPALERRVKEIIVVLLTPAGNFKLPLPRTPLQAAEIAFEQLLQGAYQTAVLNQRLQLSNGPLVNGTNSVKDASLRVATVSPVRMLGFPSFLNFSTLQAERLIKEGYDQAQKQLKSLNLCNS
ncbi:patatin-like phospholipase family protein [Desulfococcaceae bacterium HSG7]|nr:patatin-like phospholipase family protein [Desulfococcaceae bacterium HSG7]